MVLALCWATVGLLSGCGSYQRAVDPGTLSYRAHAQTKGDARVEVTTAVVTAEEAENALGIRLESKWIQALWVEVVNKDEHPYWLLFPSLDPDYYSADEVAYSFHLLMRTSEYQALAAHLRDTAFKNPVYPGQTRSGFVFVHRDDGAKEVDVQLLSVGGLEEFTFSHQVPGLRAKTFEAAAELYQEEEMQDVEEDELRFALQNLPCCTTDKEGEGEGDPLNLILIGNAEDVFPAFVRRGWHPVEEIYWGSVWKTLKSFLLGQRYLYSPVSPLYVFGRAQDVSLQKARSTVHQRNHLRLWLTPLRYRDKSIWIGQISRDIGVRFTLRSGIGVTHKIDPDVDETRNAIVQDMLFSQGMMKIGFVQGVGASGPEQPDQNLTGDPYFTDGLRVVLLMDQRQTLMRNIEFFNWDSPSDRELQLR